MNYYMIIISTILCAIHCIITIVSDDRSTRFINMVAFIIWAINLVFNLTEKYKQLEAEKYEQIYKEQNQKIGGENE